MNPISMLTGATLDLILDDPLVNRFCLAVMAEAAAIGARIGCPLDAILAAVREIGELVGTATRSIDTLLGVTRLRARVDGLY